MSDIYPFLSTYTRMMIDPSLSNSRDENFAAQCKRLTYNTLTKLLGKDAMSGNKNVGGVYRHIFTEGKSLDEYSKKWSARLNGGVVKNVSDIKPGTFLIKEGHSGEVLFWLDKDKKLTYDPKRAVYFGMRESAGEMGYEVKKDNIELNKTYYIYNDDKLGERYFKLKNSGDVSKERLNNTDRIVIGNNGELTLENIITVREIKGYALTDAVYLSHKGIIGTFDFQKILAETAFDIYKNYYDKGKATVWSGSALQSHIKSHKSDDIIKTSTNMNTQDFSSLFKNTTNSDKRITINIEHKSGGM